MTSNSCYPLDALREEVSAQLRAAGIKEEDLRIEYPPPGIDAALAFPCFRLSQKEKKAPALIAQEIAEKIKIGVLGLLPVAQGPYVNFSINPEPYDRLTLACIDEKGAHYGGEEKNEKTIIIEYSSPNIAKPMSVGHLRTTIIGQVLKQLFRFLGYRAIGINHLGDWGTQFGKLIVAFRKWGDEERLQEAPINELLRIYVLFHQEAEKDPSLEEEGRKAFNDLEKGDAGAQKLWERFRNLTLDEIDRIYQAMGVDFEHVTGESFYEDKMQKVIDAIQAKGLSEESEGAQIVPLKEHGIKQPLLLKKRDGSSLYATRDLAAAVYRVETFHPAKILYVVGSEQKLHFQQFFKVLELLGYDPGLFVHVDFGLVNLPEGKMSTREGRVIFLESLIDEATTRAKQRLVEREFQGTPEELDQLARMVGISAIKYRDIYQPRNRSITFDWDEMLSTEGNSSVYIQYALVRMKGILRKGEVEAFIDPEAAKILVSPQEIALIRELSRFPEKVRLAAKEYEPFHVADSVYEICQAFSRFYKETPVLIASEPQRPARLTLVSATARVLENGMDILGIAKPEKM